MEGKLNYSVSVIVPIFNASKHISRCAQSLFDQDMDNVEYIFVDDASTDNSREILQKTIDAINGNELPEIKVITLNKNTGPFNARMIGLEAAHGRYTMFVDADDWFESSMLSSLYSYAKANKSDIVACDYYRHSNYGRDYIRQNHLGYTKEQLFKRVLSGQLLGMVWNKLVLKSVYSNFDLRSDISMGEDRLLSIMLYFYAKKIDYLPNAYVHYNELNPDSLTSSFNDEKFYQIENLLIHVKNFLEKEKFYKNNKREFYALVMTHQHFLLKKNSDRKLSLYGEAFRFSNILLNSSIDIKKKFVFLLHVFRLQFLLRIF